MVIIAPIIAIIDEIRASLMRNDLLIEINENPERNTTKINAWGKWIRNIERIKKDIRGTKRDLGILRTLSKRRRKINIINARECGTNQAKACTKLIVLK